jgi:nuclear pore complex protein Nup50
MKDVKMTKPISTEKESTSPKKLSEYYAKLKGLNQSVAQWIKTHVDTNPVCILTPIFRDYEKYLKEIELKYVKESKSPMVTEKNVEIKLDSKPTEKIPSLNPTEKKQENFIFGGSSSKLQTEGASDSWKSEKSVFGTSSMPTKSIFSSTDKSDNKSTFNVSFNTVGDTNLFLNKSSSIDTKNNEDSPKTEDKTTSGLTFPHTSLSSTVFSFGQSSSTSTASAGFSFGG